jgi:hypothetical protein
MSDIVKGFENKPGGGVQEVRVFSDPKLQASINNALAGISQDARGAILNLERNESGWNAAVVAKLNGHWSVAVAYSKADWGHAVATTSKFTW